MINHSPIRLYYESLDWPTYVSHFFKSNKQGFLQAVQQDFNTQELFLLSSGRAGIYLSLAAAGLGRHDEVFVPPFMSACVLDAVTRGGLASLNFSTKTKAVLLYHHWGYLQDFHAVKKALGEHKPVVIEDCAHGFWGKCHGITMGSFGDTALFSLSKIFKISYSGLLRINNLQYKQKVQDRLNEPVGLYEQVDSWLGDRTYLDYYSAPLSRRNSRRMQSRLGKWYATLLTYPVCKSIRGVLPEDNEQLRSVFSTQHEHFMMMLDNTRNHPMMLAGDDIPSMAPLCFPLFHEDEAVLKQAIAWLSRKGIAVDIYRFDVNRNMFNPQYRRCVPFPLYASITRGIYEDFIKQFKGVF